MKIAFTIFRYFPFGGIQRDFLRIAQLCSERGHELHLFTLRWDGPPAQFPLQVHIVPVSAWRNHHRYEQFAQRVQDEVSRSEFDLVLGFNKMPGLDVYYAGDPCFIEHAHTDRSALYRRTGRYRHFAAFEEAVFRAGAGTQVLLLSEQQREHFQRWYGTDDERFHLLPPNVAPDRFDPPDRDTARQALQEELGIGVENEKIILMIGSSYRTKGLDRAIRALAALPRDLRRCSHLLVAGRGRRLPYMLRAAVRGVRANVHLLGGRSDVPMFLAAADVLIQPSVRESAGMTIVEAIAAQLPVIASGECGYAPHIERAGAGYALPTPFDQQSLNDRLREILTASPEQVEQWRANAQRYVREQEFSGGPARAAELIEQFHAARATAARSRSVAGAALP